ncbi:hypothetical protein [Zhihengliuella flava]|uniref:Uncharacterized protein n=1 Tax=Zhihengliuella flava TaxID=1285193 RepID=A0A931D772_9MICC|nr:hypothetical protein [Zhihengliuella flava]MBG6083278.1 hypothetical protein [Zhihengliuella flava]
MTTNTHTPKPLPALTTVRGRIERAEHALRTGQPQLAMTYMQAASDQITEERRQRQARAFEKFAEAVCDIFEALGGMLREWADLLATNPPKLGRKSDYALVPAARAEVTGR